MNQQVRNTLHKAFSNAVYMNDSQHQYPQRTQKQLNNAIYFKDKPTPPQLYSQSKVKASYKPQFIENIETLRQHNNQQFKSPSFMQSVQQNQSLYQLKQQKAHFDQMVSDYHEQLQECSRQIESLIKNRTNEINLSSVQRSQRQRTQMFNSFIRQIDRIKK